MDDYFAGRLATTGRMADLPQDAENRATATTSSRSVFIPRSSAGLFEMDGGFRRIGVATANRVYDRVLFAVATDNTASLDAATLIRGRFPSVYENPLLGVGRMKLWDCPDTLLGDTSITVTETCTVYSSPDPRASNPILHKTS